MKRMILIVAAAAMLMAARSKQDPYAIVTGNNSTMSGNLEEFLSIRKRIPERCIWFRRDGRDYVIVDETLIRRATALFEPQRALEPEQRAVSREEAQLDREIDRLEDRDDGEKLTTAEKNRLHELRARMRIVAERERALDEKEEALERETERQLWPLFDDAIRSGAAKPLRR